MMKLMLAGFLSLLSVTMNSSVWAHHGWAWTTGGNIELTGIIKTVRLGNPHGLLEVDMDGEVWVVEVGRIDASLFHLVIVGLVLFFCCIFLVV